MDAKTLIITIGLIGFMLSILPVSGNSARSFKIKEFSTWIPTIWHPIGIIENVESDMFCLAVCANNKSCKGVFRDGSKCTMFFDILIQMSKIGDSSQAVRIVRKASVVVQTVDPVSYSEAKSVCSSLDGVLASRADLQKLYDDGISLCACGWIAEGYGAYPTTIADNGCGFTVGVVQCPDVNTKRGWCKFLSGN